MKRLLFACVLVFAALPVYAQSPSQRPAGPSSNRARAPIIPANATEPEREALTQAELAISRGEFDQAAARLKPLTPPAVVRVFVDWAPVPVSMRSTFGQSLQQAMHGWNAALAGSTRFEPTQQEDAAELLIFFEQSVATFRNGQPLMACADSTADANASSQRRMRTRIALNVPYTQQTHSAASLTHLLAGAMGSYLGLAQSPSPGDVMGPDTHAPSVALTPSEADVQSARALQQARATLLDFAARHVVAYMARPLLVVETPEVDGGDVQRGDTAHFVFTLKNTGDAPLEIDARPNCGCTVAKFDRTIAAGAEGKVEADFHSAAYRGKVSKVISVTTNDAEHAATSLTLVCNVISPITVLPSEVVTIPLKVNGPTVKEFEVRVTGKDPVEVSRVTCSVPFADAKLEPEPAADGTRGYKLTVTIQPEAPMGRSAFMVTAFTTSPRQPQVNITAMCEKGILAIPVSLYLGAIQPQTTLPLVRTITILKSDGEFHIKGVSSDDPKLKIQQDTVKEGSQYRITVTYRGGWSEGTVQSKIAVETDDAAQPRLEIPVMASVLGATSR